MDNPIAWVRAVRAWLYARLLATAEYWAENWPTAEGRLAFEQVAMDNRAQTTGTGNLVSLVIGIAVAVIVGVGVAIPIVNDVLNSSNATGLTAIVVGFIPVMLAVLIFVATVGPIMNRT